MHFQNLALAGLVAPTIAAPLGALRARKAFFGDDQSICDAIGGCDGNLGTPEKREESGWSLSKPIIYKGHTVYLPGKRAASDFVTGNIKDLPKGSLNELIGGGPVVEKEKRDPQSLCMAIGGCDGDEGTGFKRDLPKEVHFDNLPLGDDNYWLGPVDGTEKRDPQSLCMAIGGCDGDEGTGFKRDVQKEVSFDNLPPGDSDFWVKPVVEKEKRDPQYGLCGRSENPCGDIDIKRAQPGFVDVNVGDLPKVSPEIDFNGIGPVIEGKRSPVDTVSANIDDLVPVGLDPAQLCGFKGC